MAKFHINQETGNVSECSARVKCPFGDLENDHFGSAEEARAAFEETMLDEMTEGFANFAYIAARKLNGDADPAERLNTPDISDISNSRLKEAFRDTFTDLSPEKVRDSLSKFKDEQAEANYPLAQDDPLMAMDVKFLGVAGNERKAHLKDVYDLVDYEKRNGAIWEDSGDYVDLIGLNGHSLLTIDKENSVVDTTGLNSRYPTKSLAAKRARKAVDAYLQTIDIPQDVHQRVGRLSWARRHYWQHNHHAFDLIHAATPDSAKGDIVATVWHSGTDEGVVTFGDEA